MSVFVPPVGLEPTTSRLKGESSNQLSYRGLPICDLSEGRKALRSTPGRIRTCDGAFARRIKSPEPSTRLGDRGKYKIWRPQQDSNLYLNFRRVSFCPLNYGVISRAHPEGFEPPTHWVEASCSDPLSYGCIAPPAGFEPATFGDSPKRPIPIRPRR